ncbi:MAG: tRNA pseudouridine(55) synthase TruB [Caulobacterales bacterium 68-7]|nr:tRNA pseudouridine(55) synthase TruB [Caulobacterales bacterium]OJU07691.1 MAG: tRNA pseudouridine(55) synthase TruB [Caulobacterales bacterium 68-7]
MARKRKGQAVNGWVCFDKPLGMGSTQAVGKLRWLYDAQKAGHAGTLDPLATGILPIALGEATKTVAFMMDAAKSYRFTVAWGETTTTLDREGAVTETSDVRPTRDAIEAAIPAFIGEILQAPPAYSAIKVDGERAYDLARAGEAVELAPRPVRIDALRLVEVEPDAATFEVDCGKGTYVRSLARDLAAALGACGHVSVLRRTRVGSFTEASAISLETLEDLRHKARALEGLLPVETALDDIPALAITEDDALLLVQGRSIVLLPRDVETLSARLSGDARTVSAMANGRLTALCEMRAGRLNPVRVFNLT